MTQINDIEKSFIKNIDEDEPLTHEHCDTRMTIRDDNLRQNLLRRLRRVEGQVRGISGMIEKDVYCDDVLHQITAARSALSSISKMVLEDHIHGCLVARIRDGEDEVVDELLVTIGKMLR